MAAYFHSYVGALFISKGSSPIQEWISKLIDPDASPAQGGIGIH
jgi:dsRNA-specific ribonuclease